MALTYTRRTGVDYDVLVADEAAALARARATGDESLLVWELNSVYVLGRKPDIPDGLPAPVVERMQRARHTRLLERASYDAPLRQSTRFGGDMWMGPGVLRATLVLDLAAREVRFSDHRDAMRRAAIATCEAFGVTGVTVDPDTCIMLAGGARLGIVTAIAGEGIVTQSGVAIYVTGEVALRSAVLEADGAARNAYTSLMQLGRGRPPTMDRVVTEFVAACEREHGIVVQT